MSMVRISYGMKEPGSSHLRSECAILAGMARTTLPDSTQSEQPVTKHLVVEVTPGQEPGPVD